MPIYEFSCASCNQSFETYVRSWGESVRCPSCGDDHVEKQISRFSAHSEVVGKGGGCGCRAGGCACHGSSR